MKIISKRQYLIVFILFVNFLLLFSLTLLPVFQITTFNIEASGHGPIYSSPSNDKLLFMGPSGGTMYDMEGNKLAEEHFASRHLNFYSGSAWSADEKLIVFDDYERVYFVYSDNLTLHSSIGKRDLLQFSTSNDSFWYWSSNYHLTDDYNLLYYHNNSVWQFDLLSKQISELWNTNRNFDSDEWGLISGDGNGLGVRINDTSWEFYNFQNKYKITIIADQYLRASYSPHGNKFIIVEEESTKTISAQIIDLDSQKVFPKIEISTNSYHLQLSEELQWSQDKTEILIIQPNYQDDNKYEVSDTITTIDYATGEIKWERTFNKGPIYDASIQDYTWISDQNKVIILDLNGHDPKQILIVDLDDDRYFDLTQFSLNFLGIAFSMFILAVYFIYNPKHWSFLVHNLLNRKKDYIYPILLKSAEITSEAPITNDTALISKYLSDQNWIGRGFFYFNLGIVITLILNFQISPEIDEDIAYSYTRVIIQAIFAYLDIFILGLLTLTYIGLNRHHLNKFQFLTLVFGYIFWTIMTIMLRYYQGFSFGSQTPFLTYDTAKIYNFLRMYVIVHIILLKQPRNPILKTEFPPINIGLPIFLIILDFLIIAFMI